jgi:DNA helicase II / ATP-dependent DNA helicase PcrA
LLYRNNWQGSYLRERLEQNAAMRDSLKYMTIHSSKGLEFGTVIIAGVSDKIIPDASSDIEEERRLFYVAMTRAKDNLYIVHHKSDDGELSIFANELGLGKK